jgi:predicted Co/Zn/Cd cation transporter (cation efflux family)
MLGVILFAVAVAVCFVIGLLLAATAFHFLIGIAACMIR